MIKIAENVVLATSHQRASYVRAIQMARPVQPAVAHLGGVYPHRRNYGIVLSKQVSKE